MGLVARNPEKSQLQQGSGELVGSPPAYANGVVHHESIAGDGTVVAHSQRFEAGELVEWTLQREQTPWALVRHGEPTDRCGTGYASPETVESVQVRIGTESLVLPPLDDLPNPAFEHLEEIPDATARLRFELTGTPVGRILCDLRYQDGRRPFGRVVQTWSPDTRAGEPAHDAPLIEVGFTFANYLRLRTGEKTALEAIADGGDVGDTRWTLLLLLHGIVQRRPYVEAYRALPVMPSELGWWGEAAPFIASDAEPRWPSAMGGSRSDELT